MVRRSPELYEYLGERPDDPKDRFRVPEAKERCQSLPSGFTPIRLRGAIGEAPYLHYLRRRGVTDEDVVLYRMGYVPSGQEGGRVVVPTFDCNGAVCFWSARTIHPSVRPSYRLPHASKDVVSNEHMVDWSKPVYLVEGVFDEVAIGPQAIALYGKFMMPQLALRLVEKRPPMVNVCLDDDADREAFSLMQRLVGYDVPCAMVRLDSKDPATAGGAAVERAASEASRVTGSIGLVGMRL